MLDAEERRLLICHLTDAARQLDKTVDALARQIADLAGVSPDSEEITDLIWNSADLDDFCNEHMKGSHDA